MGFFRQNILIFFVAALMSSCQGEHHGSNRSLDIFYYTPLHSKDLVVDYNMVMQTLLSQSKNDVERNPEAQFAQEYYARNKTLLWINYQGVDSKADSLWSFLKKAKNEGISDKILNLMQIEDDISCAKWYSFTSDRPAGKVLARLEYNLTKAYLKYASIVGFGLVTPFILYNRLDHADNDSTGKKFRELYGIPTKTVDRDFLKTALNKLTNDSLVPFLRSLEPTAPLYHRLVAILNSDTLTSEKRMKVICNIERCRWRINDHPYMHSKYVQVNLPAFRLYAVDAHNFITMKVGVGTRRTKTPLLTSRIKRIELNPQWIIPKSIIDKDIISHAGDPEYFERHNYYVRNKKTGEKLNLYELTAVDLRNRDNHVIQEGGAGNSLGRIVFRFDNDYSVYLHHTSTLGFFNREDRGVSHGCIRVEHPYELACFLLKDKDEDLFQRIHYSMTVDLKSPSLNKGKLVHSLTVTPEIPLFITYYTIYIDPTTKQTIDLPDIYGYDKVLYERLKTYGL